MVLVVFPVIPVDAAMLYTCTDASGNVSITDSPPPDSTCALRERGSSAPPRGVPTAGNEALAASASVDSIMPKAEVIENLSYTYYPADADSRQSLRTILNASSPLRQDGRVVWGYYTPQVSWKLRWVPKPDGSCRIIKVTVELNGNITLPRLQGMTHAQRAKFDAFLSALRLHELGHHGISRDAAAAIGSRILALPAMSCTALTAAANDVAQQTLKECRERDVRYDVEERTNWTKGVRLD